MRKCPCKNYREDYIRRVLGSKGAKDLEIAKAEEDFLRYLQTSPTAKELYVTDVGEPCITDKTKKILVSVTDYSNNDDTAFDEKNLFTLPDANVDIGSYVRFDGGDWLVTFKEHQSINVKKHFIMRKCNNIVAIKYEGEIYNIPVVVQNLTMYSDGVADNIYMSFMDSKKQLWYSDNKVTRNMMEGFRVLLTHRTAFRITHINDVEYKGLTKALVLQTQMVDGDRPDINLADNTSYYKKTSFPNNTKDPVPDMDCILGDKHLTLGEEREYKVVLSNKHNNVDWELSDTKAFTIEYKNDLRVVVRGNLDMKYVGKKAKLELKDKDTNEVIDTLELILGV